ncbi:MAG: alpha/beta hydrolase [Candidatus Hydrogenedentes bacterium]|nr:alpha/beta hydrolase [Candidatus Hydrogenedentota bacterium]
MSPDANMNDAGCRRLARPALGFRLLRFCTSCAAVLLLCAVSLKQCPSLPENCSKLSMIDVGGYSLAYKDEGAGGPLVVLLAGEDDNTTVWRKVQPGVSEFTRVIAYDRGGVGCSDEGENPRTVEKVTDELDAFLDALQVNDPVILCGQSFGGLFARYFANQHPDRVAGIVLVDATHERLEYEMALSLKPQSLEKEDLEYGVYFGISGRPGVWGEYYNRFNTYNTIAQNRALPDVPLIYLSAGKYDPGLVPEEQATAADALKETLDEDQVSLSPQGVLIEVAKTGHDIQIDEPQTVIDAVKQVFDMVTAP